VVRDTALVEVIEDIRTDIEAAGLERVFLLGEIEERNVFERDVIEIEVAAKSQMNREQFREPGGGSSDSWRGVAGANGVGGGCGTGS
jgi:hypothetical protein